MNTHVAAVVLFFATVVSSAPSGPWASAPLVIAPQPIYHVKPVVSEWAAPVKKEGWAAPVAAVWAPAKVNPWASAKVEQWAPAKADPWASTASAWSSQVVLKPAYVPLKTVKYVPAPHYYVPSAHSW